MKLGYYALIGLRSDRSYSMRALVLIIAGLAVCTSSDACGNEPSARAPDANAMMTDGRTEGCEVDDRAVTITQSKLLVDETRLELCYRIHNNSRHDIWVCDNVDVGSPATFEVYFRDNGHCVRVRRCATIVPGDAVVMREEPQYRYRRLRAGEHRDERMMLPLPVRPQTVWASSHLPTDETTVPKLHLEVGYFALDLPATILCTLACDEQVRRTHDEIFAWEHELPERCERILSLSVEECAIPCAPELSQSWDVDLGMCTRLEISWHPSALAYLLPHADQRRLLSAVETKSLCARGSTTVAHEVGIRAVATDIRNGVKAGIAVGGAKARVTCYLEDRRTVSFDVYGNAIVTAQGTPFIFPDFDEAGFPSLRKVTPQIQAIECRVQCAGNLDRLLARWRVRATENHTPAMSGKWCDEIVSCYSGVYTEEFVAEPFTCPSAGEGKCHYAMNPNCQPDSAGDTVLLFETKAGWNQHGGPELFTFDNHEPQGGCVLLNDGTVRFIRTKEELHALRWK